MSWILPIVGVVMLSVLADVLLPDGHINKYVKGVFSLLLVFTVLTPVKAFVKGEISFFGSGQEEAAQVNVDTSYLTELRVRRQAALSENLQTALAEAGIITESVEVSLDEDDVYKISNVLVVLPYGERREERETTIKDLICGHSSMGRENIVIVYGR